MKSPVQIFVAIAVLLATATVAAQVYKWVDKDGQVQYTDTPPPPGAAKVEAKKINSTLASTAIAPTITTSTPGAKPGDAAKAPKDKAKDAVKDAEKRKTDASNAAKKDEETQRNAKANEERCKAATGNLREYESGRPIVRTNDSGERIILGDDERSAESIKMRALMAEACK